MSAKAEDKSRKPRPIGAVGQAYLAAKAVQNAKTLKAFRKIAEAGK